MATSVIITPALGHGLVSTQGGAPEGYDAVDDRRVRNIGRTNGVLDAASFRPAANAATLAVDVAASSGLGALVEGVSVPAQGLYYVAPHASLITLDIAPGDATNPRVDLVVLKVADATHDGGGANEATLEVLQGTPTAGADQGNMSGAVDTSALSCIVIADMLVPNGQTGPLPAANVRDRRTYGLVKDDIGALKPHAGLNAPDGYAFADGSEVSRVVLADLFAEIGEVGGAGDGSTTFNLPDTDGRTIVGPDNAKGRAPAAAGPGTAGGEDTHTLSTGEMPAHSHGVSDPGHSHLIHPRAGGTPVNGTPDLQSTANAWRLDTEFRFDNPAYFTGAEDQGFTDTKGTGIGINNAGGGGAHNNMQPFLTLRWVIFTGSVAGQ